MDRPEVAETGLTICLRASSVIGYDPPEDEDEDEDEDFEALPEDEDEDEDDWVVTD